MKSFIKGTHHINIKAKDNFEFGKIIGFYCDILLLSPVRSWDDGNSKGAMISTGDCIIEVVLDTQAKRGSGSLAHIAFLTDDVDKVVHIVREAGYEITVEPKDVTLPTGDDYKIRIAFCKGPGGEHIEFYQEK